MKFKSVRRYVALALAGILTLSMAACGNSPKESGSTESLPASNSGAASSAASSAEAGSSAGNSGGETGSYEGKEIKVWISSGAEDEIYMKMFREIEGDLSIKIVDEYYSKDELDSKMQSAPIAGDMPDAVVADYLLIPKYYDAGMVANLNDYVSDELMDDFLPSVVDECTLDGKIISVAQFDSGLALWANKEMLEAAQVRIPESYKDAWDRAEFEDALKKLKESGVKYPLYVRQNKPSTEYFTFVPLLASFGGDYMNRETGLCTGTLDSPETIEMFNYVKWLFDEGYCDRSCDYETSFQQKENALVLNGHYKYSDYKEIGEDNLIIIPIPDMGNGVFTCSGSTVMIMTTGAQDAGVDDAVWAMLEAATSPKYINMVVSVNGAVPSRSSVMESSELYAEGGKLYLYREQLEAGISFLRPYTCAHKTIYDAVTSVIANIYAGADPEAELKEAAVNIDDVISGSNWSF